jgi:pantothenate kinase
MNEEILVALGRLEGKVDALITRQSLVDEELARQEKRIRSLEQSKSYVIGAAAMVGAAVSLLVRFLKLEN